MRQNLIKYAKDGYIWKRIYWFFMSLRFVKDLFGPVNMEADRRSETLRLAIRNTAQKQMCTIKNEIVTIQ